LSRWAKFYGKLWSGQADNEIEFDELVTYLERLNFSKSGGSGGSHHKMKHVDCLGLVNLQPKSDGKAKSYQVDQVRKVLETYQGVEKDAWLEGRA
jgi:hypothetical protein